MTAAPATTMTVLSPGTQTTVQDLAGRGGMWDVGVPPSGAWDDLSFALANAAVGNPPGAAGLEAVVTGPVLRFDRRTTICLTGAAPEATVDSKPIRPGVVTTGSVVDLGRCGGPGMRAYLAVAGGLVVPEVFGSKATFLLGGFGGLEGRALVARDTMAVGRTENLAAPVDVASLLPAMSTQWTVRVLAGPHGAPEHLTPEGAAELLGAGWTIDHRADRTGVRLAGPAPRWARQDGGEAGLHPSNIHDSAYPVGGIMLSGDTPVVVGPDGPSLGGFVVPFTVIHADRWKFAQARPGDTVRLVLVAPEEADNANAARAALLADPRGAVVAEFERTLAGRPAPEPVLPAAGPELLAEHGLLLERPADGAAPALVIRRAGDHHVLAEAGPPVLDLRVRVWVHLLAQALRAAAPDGVAELVEGVRSLLVRVDPDRLPLAKLAGLLGELAAGVPDPAGVTLDVREVTLPIAFDHPAAHEAMARYARSVRPDAPWCPDNVEFIRRINDLGERDEVFRVVRDATYLVIGLGDVYLGAPVALPIDPRHRLVTTKYDPARTWTPQNAVGIGGVYLCVYGMEGPGGYQLVGRTVPVWRHVPGSAEPPWLLRQFDRLRFSPVSAGELADLRAEVKAGKALETRPARFSLSEVDELETRHRAEIELFRKSRQAAFDAERERWRAR
ncbi:5-oxoprolinase/urea amidolyase family protein [Amycolatopsis alkalitolerans]|uniref:5-oxoprolinase/urea amidolyase family protein n=1 Tax=Amycolatopsis alkalitolerans TaxID=2547244 RepID=A0A5C4LXA6_9PSEU|nr:5-oxoprolinase/urea amidolyase family protein [Amycolatopsis alkalitolerans]TNC23579.1 5-oxoprolinase/urea amidolyase family protein [Amycolatopsis alkalitolerans]